MLKQPRDENREQRITIEIVVDAYDETERALGWYYYLQDHLQFPFTAQCIRTLTYSPLRTNEQVEVFRMPPEHACEREMQVMIRLLDRALAVPLAQFLPITADATTQEAVADWQYWLNQGYAF